MCKSKIKTSPITVNRKKNGSLKITIPEWIAHDNDIDFNSIVGSDCVVVNGLIIIKTDNAINHLFKQGE